MSVLEGLGADRGKDMEQSVQLIGCAAKDGGARVQVATYALVTKYTRVELCRTEPSAAVTAHQMVERSLPRSKNEGQTKGKRRAVGRKAAQATAGEHDRAVDVKDAAYRRVNQAKLKFLIA
jgi:hypothetical protein